MTTQFKNFDSKTRAWAVEELITDFKNRNLYVSRKLASGKILNYYRGLVQALLYGNDSSFAQYLITQNCLTAEALKRSNAAEELAYNEFKRYYIRGVCLKALISTPKKLLQVCYAKRSENPSKDAANLIGNTLHPERMIDVARAIPGNLNEGDNRFEHRILRPNSSLCVEIYDAGKTIDNGGKTNG